MDIEDRLLEMRNEAMGNQLAEPRETLERLKSIVDKHQDTLTVRNYVIPDIIGIAQTNEWWDEAAETAELATTLKPQYRESYEMEAHAFRLHNEGEHYEALEVLFAASGLHRSPRYREFANRFAEIGAHDRAWTLFNEAIGEAYEEGWRTHTIRFGMTELLLKEGKPDAAVEMMITTIHEAELIHGDSPKVAERHLRKALRAAGFNLRLKKHRKLPGRLIETCKLEGERAAVDLFYAWKETGGEPEEWERQIAEESEEQVAQDQEQEPSLLKRLLKWARRDE